MLHVVTSLNDLSFDLIDNLIVTRGVNLVKKINIEGNDFRVEYFDLYQKNTSKLKHKIGAPRDKSGTLAQGQSSEHFHVFFIESYKDNLHADEFVFK